MNGENKQIRSEETPTPIFKKNKNQEVKTQSSLYKTKFENSMEYHAD